MFSEQELSQATVSILGEQLSTKELEVCLLAVEIIKPPPAKLFWQKLSASSGIYIVLAGKVRILEIGSKSVKDRCEASRKQLFQNWLSSQMNNLLNITDHEQNQTSKNLV